MSAAAAPSRALVIRSIDETTSLEARSNQKTAESVSEQSLQQRLEQLAYALWEERGRPEGSPETDWTEAMRQLRGAEAMGTTEKGAIAKTAVA